MSRPAPTKPLFLTVPASAQIAAAMERHETGTVPVHQATWTKVDPMRWRPRGGEYQWWRADSEWYACIEGEADVQVGDIINVVKRSGESQEHVVWNIDTLDGNTILDTRARYDETVNNVNALRTYLHQVEAMEEIRPVEADVLTAAEAHDLWNRSYIPSMRQLRQQLALHGIRVEG